MAIETYFQSLNIPEDSALKLKTHLDRAQTFVVQKDMGVDCALDLIKTNLESSLPSDVASILYSIAEANRPTEQAAYTETGYDSHQSGRKVARVLAESILLGGLTHEFNILGIPITVFDAKKLINSNLNMTEKEAEVLPNIANQFGASQDFLFPGVTPTDEQTPPLIEFAYKALLGAPITSVRNLTGIGGVRNDKDWNYAADFATFIKLKIKEDMRYYPGVGIYYALLTRDLSEIPLIDNLKHTDPTTYEHFKDFADDLQKIPEKMYEGVTVLCSAYIPSWREMKVFQSFASLTGLEIAESFHSPAYDFAQLKTIFNSDRGLEVTDVEVAQLQTLRSKFANIWSFNSTIHLPWTSELAGLSNDLVGSITNFAGDSAIRYGIGYAGKSLEVREYNFGVDRKFPQGVSCKKAYALLFYSDSELFEGEKTISFLTPDDQLWEKFQKEGFIGPALKYLEEAQ